MIVEYLTNFHSILSVNSLLLLFSMHKFIDDDSTQMQLDYTASLVKKKLYFQFSEGFLDVNQVM